MSWVWGSISPLHICRKRTQKEVKPWLSNIFIITIHIRRPCLLHKPIIVEIKGSINKRLTGAWIAHLVEFCLSRAVNLRRMSFYHSFQDISWKLKKKPVIFPFSRAIPLTRNHLTFFPEDFVVLIIWIISAMEIIWLTLTVLGIYMRKATVWPLCSIFSNSGHVFSTDQKSPHQFYAGPQGTFIPSLVQIGQKRRVLKNQLDDDDDNGR